MIVLQYFALGIGIGLGLALSLFVMYVVAWTMEKLGKR